MSKTNPMVKIISVIVCICILFSFTACQKTPESSLVKNKDLDKLIDEAKTPGTDKVDISDIAEKYDSYKTTITDESLGVTVNVDAKVDIPKADKLSVFRIDRERIDQAFVDKLIPLLFKEEKLYDGHALKIKTKRDIESEIAMLRQSLKESEEEVLKTEYQGLIDELEKEYKSAPSEINIKKYPSDGKLISYDEANRLFPDSAFNIDFSDSDNCLYIANDGENGVFSTLYAQNSEIYGNRIQYCSSLFCYSDLFVLLDDNGLTGRYNPLGTDDNAPDNYIYDGMITESPAKYKLSEGETATGTLQDSVKIADDFISKIGLSDFKFYEGDKYTHLVSYDEKENTKRYREVYLLTYYRNIDGVFLTQSSGTKNDMSSSENYSKRSWGGEYIIFEINDCGIVGFTYGNPIKITDTVVENSALKPYEEIKTTFEKMITVSKASTEYKYTYDISRVRLSYSRISEADNYSGGLIVPVWDFSGHYQISGDGWILSEGEGSALCINAIDGTIIDPDLGY